MRDSNVTSAGFDPPRFLSMIRLLARPRPVPFSSKILRRDLRASVTDGSCYSLMVGLGETYFGAFFIAAGIGNFSIGLLATLPILLGSVLQMITPWGIRRLGSYRAWAVLGAGLQAASLLVLAGLCWMQQTGFWTILTVMVLYWGSSMAVGPAWNTWMEFVIPRAIRTRFLSSRMRICQFCLLVAVCAGGLLLRNADQALMVFAGLFLAAGMLRLISSTLLGKHTEQPHWLANHQQLALQAGADSGLGASIRQTVPFFVAIQFAVYISGPFFTPFMLRGKGMDYGAFMLLIVLGYAGRVLTLHWASEVARRWGPGRLLWLGTLGLIPLSGLWVFHHWYLALVLIQLIGGVAWGFYELAVSLVFIERIPGHLRARVLSVFGVMNGLAMVGGSLIGGWIVFAMGSSLNGFLMVFVLSSVVRCCALGLFPRAIFDQAAPQRISIAENLGVATPHVNGRPLVRPFTILPDANRPEDGIPADEIHDAGRLDGSMAIAEEPVLTVRPARSA